MHMYRFLATLAVLAPLISGDRSSSSTSSMMDSMMTTSSVTGARDATTNMMSTSMMTTSMMTTSTMMSGMSTMSTTAAGTSGQNLAMDTGTTGTMKSTAGAARVTAAAWAVGGVVGLGLGALV